MGDHPPAEQASTLEFADADKGIATEITVTVRYASQEARDAALASGMIDGAAKGYDRLAEQLTRLQPSTPGGDA